MLKLSRRHMDTIVAHARIGLPHEACGLLAGERCNNERIVRKVYALTNTDASAEHFSMDAREQFRAIADMRSLGLELLGNFHSHPATPARPSQEDIKLAFDPSLSYAIISLMESEPGLKSFRVQQGTAREEDIVVFEDEDEPDRTT